MSGHAHDEAAIRGVLERFARLQGQYGDRTAVDALAALARLTVDTPGQPPEQATAESRDDRSAVASGTAPEPHRWVEQRTDYDCLTACLASIFGVPYEHAPQLWDAEKAAPVFGWHRVMDDWLAARGFASLERVRQTDDETDDPMRCPWRFPGYWIGGVKSPRIDGGHAVVMHLGELVWDPHPQRDMGHLGFEDATYFLPLDPARLALGDPPLVRSAALREFSRPRAAGVSGGTPPAACDGSSLCKAATHIHGCFAERSTAGLGDDGGPVAVDTAPFYPGRGGCVCDMRGELDDGECAYFSDPCWVDRAAYERSLRSGSGTPTGSARLPDIDVDFPYPTGTSRVGLLEEALRGALAVADGLESEGLGATLAHTRSILRAALVGVETGLGKEHGNAGGTATPLPVVEPGRDV